MTHVPETGVINWLHFSGTVCHAYLAPDSFGTRFWCQLEHISIPARKWHADAWNDNLWLVDDNCLHFNVFTCCNLITNYEFIVYVAFSHVYLWHQKFSFQSDVVWKTDAENRRQKMDLIYGAGFWSVCHGYKRETMMYISTCICLGPSVWCRPACQMWFHAPDIPTTVLWHSPSPSDCPDKHNHTECHNMYMIMYNPQTLCQ